MIAALRRISLTRWILISMVVGVAIGWLDNEVWTSISLAPYLSPISTVFIKLIKSIVVPLIFGSLVVGIAGHGEDIKRVGRLAHLVVFLQPADRGRRPSRQRRRQRGGEDEAVGVAADRVDDHAVGGDVAAHDAERLAQRPLDDVDVRHHPVALGHARPAGTVHADRVHLVQVGHGAVLPGQRQ